MVEGAGGDFSAKQLGKWKMVLQCAAVAVALWCLIEQSPGPLWLWLRSGTLWAAIVLTVLSGIEYVLLVVRAPKPA